jgi:uncharacterized membrane protein
MLKSHIIATIVLLVFDLVWVGTFMGKKYQDQVQQIQNDKMVVRPLFAVLAYLLMVIGLNVFVLPRIRKGYELQDSIKYGFLFGIVLYGVYDFTIAAVLKDWNISLAITDVLWGGIVYFLAAYIGTKLSNM